MEQRDELIEKVSRLIRQAQVTGSPENLAEELISAFEVAVDEAREPYSEVDQAILISSVMGAVVGLITDQKFLIVRQSDGRAVIETDDVEYAQRYADTYPGEYRVVERKHFKGRVH